MLMMRITFVITERFHIKIGKLFNFVALDQQAYMLEVKISRAWDTTVQRYCKLPLHY